VIQTARLQGHFEADGADIRGEITLSRRELLGILGVVSGFLGGGAPRPRPSASAPASASVEVPVPPPAPSVSP
jgi:hypothetical protein